MLKFLFIINDFIIDPLGIGYLSSVLKRDENEVDIIKTKKENLWVKLREYSPDVVAFSTTTGWHTHYIKLAQKIKKIYPSVITIFGGPHPTFFPEMVFEDGVDAVCRGEGEKAIVALANAIKENYFDQFPIPNIWTKTYQSKNFFDLEPVDTIPFPDRELIYKYPENRNNPIKNIMCSRGCIFRCSYCYNNTMRQLYPDWGVRRRSHYLIVEEAIQLKQKYPVDLIFFQDDIFATKREIDWLERFIKLWKTEVNIPFHVQLRYNLVNRDMLKLLKEGGCESITLAIETANRELASKLLHRPVNPKMLKDVIEWSHQLGMRVRLECMVGLPTETIEDSLSTLKLVSEVKPDMSWTSIYQPYPRTELGDMATKMGLFDCDINNFPKDFFSRSMLNQKNKYLFENLQKFFALGVDYPKLQPFIKKIIQFPPNFLFQKFYSIYKKRKYSKLYKVG